LDLQMPNMSGVELHSHLSDLGLDIPIIFISAYPDKIDKVRASNAGAICFLSLSTSNVLSNALKRR
jgi:FixJ family two-component response regulator